MRMRGRVRSGPGNVPVISKLLLWLFQRLVRVYFLLHFQAVRVSGMDRLEPAILQSSPLILYANHCSWWDPMAMFLLAEEYLPHRKHFAPMDAEALKRNTILRHIGIFPVKIDAPNGAAQFLRTGEAIANAGGVLWVTPQGRFADPRERPLRFKAGLASLALRVAPCVAVPVAVEYPFWSRRRPECLVRFGIPVDVRPGQNSTDVQAGLSATLESAMDELKQLALRRDPTDWCSTRGGVFNPVREQRRDRV